MEISTAIFLEIGTKRFRVQTIILIHGRILGRSERSGGFGIGASPYGYGRVRYIVVESILYSAARAVYGFVSRQHTSHGSEVVYVDSRPRYDPGTYDSYCARSRNERSLHDLPLLDRQIADPPVQRSIDREQRSAHTGHRRLSYGCIDMTTFPSMRK